LVVLGGRNLSGDINTATLSRSAEAPEVTALGDNTRQRITGGLKDSAFSFAGFFNDNTGALEQQMDALLSTGSGVFGLFPHGSTSPCCVGYEGVAIETEYSIESPVDGVVALSATWTGSGPCDRTILLHSLSACSTAGSVASSSYDYGGSRAGTLAGYLRVLAGSGADPTLDVKIQHSNNEATWADLITFTQVVAGSVVQRLEVTSASQYVRANITIGGSAGVEFSLMTSMG